MTLEVLDKNKMSNKNLHNIKVGSDIERTDNRINQTGEVFTPMELCKKITSTYS